jgi:hypothetical protein
MLSGARAVVGVAVDLVCVVAVYLPCLILDLIGEQKPQHIMFTYPSCETPCILQPAFLVNADPVPDPEF